MAIERNYPFPFDKKDAKYFETTSFKEDAEEDDGFEAVLEISKDNPADPHLRFDIEKLSTNDFKLAEKFKNDSLTEKEISGHIENLEKKGVKPGNPRYDFAASLKNKIVAKEGWRKRMERKAKEKRPDLRGEVA